MIPILSGIITGQGKDLTPAKGFVLGALLTALVQSSSAVTGIAVALVESGTILFRSSLPVFLGANIGTTSTAWLVSLNLTVLGPVLIVISAVTLVLHGGPRLSIDFTGGYLGTGESITFSLGLNTMPLPGETWACAPKRLRSRLFWS